VSRRMTGCTLSRPAQHALVVAALEGLCGFPPTCGHIGSTAGGTPTLCNAPAGWAGVVRWSRPPVAVEFRCGRHKGDLTNPEELA
jgi:hypothetical protein